MTTMQTQRYSLVAGKNRETLTWILLDENGKQRAEMSYTEDTDIVIAALNMTRLLVANCARTGIAITEYARYQFQDE
jgi:hypothetical protein